MLTGVSLSPGHGGGGTERWVFQELCLAECDSCLQGLLLGPRDPFLFFFCPQGSALLVVIVTVREA
jgi:hypothetical protein